METETNQLRMLGCQEPNIVFDSKIWVSPEECGPSGRSILTLTNAYHTYMFADFIALASKAWEEGVYDNEDK